MSSKMSLYLLANQVLRLYSIFQPPKDGLFVIPKFIFYPLPLCFKLYGLISIYLFCLIQKITEIKETIENCTIYRKIICKKRFAVDGTVFHYCSLQKSAKALYTDIDKSLRKAAAQIFGDPGGKFVRVDVVVLTDPCI